MWKRYLGPLVQIVGIDINESCGAFEEDQIAVRIGDQKDPQFLSKVLGGVLGRPMSVIDDGSHMSGGYQEVPSNISTIAPRQAASTLVEDLHTAYWTEFDGGARREGGFIELCKSLIDELNADHARDQVPVTDFTKSMLSMNCFMTALLSLSAGAISKSMPRRSGSRSEYSDGYGDSYDQGLESSFSFLLAISNLYNTPQSFVSKTVLLIRILRNRLRVTSATGFVEQLAMISALLRLPASVEGSVVECGCYEGGSTTNLSLAAKLVGRKLYVFDSFRGLPEPKPKDVRHLAVNLGRISLVYSRGSWCGSLKSVKANVAKYGSLEVCTFIVGYFDSTLPDFSEVTLLFLRFAMWICGIRWGLCLRYLWPLMPSSGVLFTHEAHHLEIASLFYDHSVWPDSAPGLVGAGSGLGLTPTKDGSFGSCIGYVIKSPAVVVESIELGTRERYRTHVKSVESC